MKKLTTSILLLSLFSFYSFASKDGHSAVIDQLFGNSHFAFEQIDQEIVVSMQKLPWEGFTFSLANEDFFNNPICRIHVKSYEDLVLRVELSDGETIFEGGSAISFTIEGNDEYQELVFNFSGAISNFNVTSQPYLIFYVNPGQNHNGEMMIKNIQFSAPEKEDISSPSEILPEIFLYPNPATDKINIELPDNFEGKVIIFDITGREVFETQVFDSYGKIAIVDISKLRAGTYLLNLIGQSNALSNRFYVN
ncbi:MAG: T9SS type A sorting domain-containing protein [Bacteroidales bacterium]|nr:T9SS type A sorting domain-containing protein [Bacteroidales bacterium]